MTELFKNISDYPFVTIFLVICIGLFLEWIKEMTELFIYHNQKDEDIEDEEDEDKEEDWREKI